MTDTVRLQGSTAFDAGKIRLHIVLAYIPIPHRRWARLPWQCNIRSYITADERADSIIENSVLMESAAALRLAIERRAITATVIAYSTRS
jgi:hypothetical protein